MAGLPMAVFSFFTFVNRPFGKHTFKHSSFIFNLQASLDNQTLSVRVLTAQASCLEGAVAARDLGKTASADDEVSNFLKHMYFPCEI